MQKRKILCRKGLVILKLAERSKLMNPRRQTKSMENAFLKIAADLAATEIKAQKASLGDCR
jgi:hypothetical protein